MNDNLINAITRSPSVPRSLSDGITDEYTLSSPAFLVALLFLVVLSVALIFVIIQLGCAFRSLSPFSPSSPSSSSLPSLNHTNSPSANRRLFYNFSIWSRLPPPSSSLLPSMRRHSGCIYLNPLWSQTASSSEDECESLATPSSTILNLNISPWWRRNASSSSITSSIEKECPINAPSFQFRYFGNVYKGIYREGAHPKSSHVAIKTLKADTSHDLDCVEKLMEEASVMMGLDHPNVLSLLGVVISNNGSPWMVLPFMDQGDLRSYIANPTKMLCVIDLLSMGVQVCRGMAYLASKGIIHRDLAARNCMISSDRCVRVADFGLAIQSRYSVYDRDQPIPDRLPLKWLALETLRDRSAFSTHTDVWSFGVLLWELLSRASSPYSQLSNHSVRSFLESGGRLSQPLYCPDNVYELLLSCWRISPLDRPSFSSLHHSLSSLLSLFHRHPSFTVSVPPGSLAPFYPQPFPSHHPLATLPRFPPY
ncbi:hypothetical protein PRIPAC_80866 [Pristionchus pacificus]|uniref:receptor protein-tyrosine kinase n=1 Tax=Pristionchus pacificus TaxID=54126 RepID=A0A2A6CBA5_PRIPA|nr:hypothetical protein PRIPAC_80866 [Pristionchus pacificus]|eukprot:PDM75454.1 protein kinase [Pristionchus pacificus]